MKKFHLISLCTLLFIIILWSCKEKAEAEEYIATNVETTSSNCNLSSTEFNTWFTAGVASENGSVDAANSVDFKHENNCDFYKWSERMFLWITSNSGDGTVMESPVFYTISPVKSTSAGDVREFIPHTEGVPLRAFSNVDKTDDIETEQGQAGSDDVLMDRYGNLVYYISFGNDVYAQFLTAVKNDKMGGETFPTTVEERDSIVDFAKKYNVDLSDANALAIELKTSWIIAESLDNVDDFVTVEAIIPTYNKSDSVWVITGEETATLAMVGMHIVGSAANHPEMIWATFEHENNTPNTAYQYISNGETITVPADGDGSWIFNSDVSDPPNVSHMTFSGDSIIAQPNHKISPSNTTLEKPWGSSYDSIPNPEDSSPAAANTTVLNLNQAIAKLLPGSDLRKNYLFIGATWTNNGAAPNGKSYSPSENEDGVAIGTSQLANSTMETYFQNGPDYAVFSSCFMCHNKNNGLKPTDLSHVFSKIEPLFSESISTVPETP